MYPRIQSVQAAPPPATDTIFRQLESQVNEPARAIDGRIRAQHIKGQNCYLWAKTGRDWTSQTSGHINGPVWRDYWKGLMVKNARRSAMHDVVSERSSNGPGPSAGKET